MSIEARDFYRSGPDHRQGQASSFALAKNAGPGSIAHEWFHAFNHYVATKCFRGIPNGLFASTAWLADATPISHPLNQLLMECFKAILLQPAGEQPSELFQHSVQVDKSSVSSTTANPKSSAPALLKPLCRMRPSPITFWSKAPRPLLKRKEVFTYWAHSGSRSMQRSAAILVGLGKR